MVYDDGKDIRPLHAFFPNFHFPTWKSIDNFMIYSFCKINLDEDEKERLDCFIKQNLGAKYGLFTDIPIAGLEVIKSWFRMMPTQIINFLKSSSWLPHKKGKNKTLICSEAGIRAIDAVYGKKLMDKAIRKIKLPEGYNKINPMHVEKLIQYKFPKMTYKRLAN